jgi:hypothetical protein
VLTINDRNGELTDYATYCLDLSLPQPQWLRLYRCAATYHLGSTSLLNRISHFPFAVGNPMVISYRQFFNGKSLDRHLISNDEEWPYYYASISSLNSNTYKQCVSGLVGDGITLRK